MLHPINRFGRVAAIIAALLFLPASFVAQSSLVKYSLDTPIANQPMTNDCNGDTVLVNGTNHFDYFFDQQADGRINFHIHSETHLTGTGQTSGAKYVGDQSTDYQTRTGGGQTSDFTDIEKLKLVAQ